MFGNDKESKPPTFDAEPAELAQLILAKLDHNDPVPHDDFVRHRFWRPFEHSINRADRYSILFTIFTLLVIGGGVASSLLTQISWGGSDTAIAVIGVLVALAAGVNRIWRPGVRAALRHRVANDLRREGWSFVCDEGRYKELTENKVSTFFKEVERINASAEAIDETPSDDSGKT